MVRIITDSAADFEPLEISLLDIETIPLTVSFGNVHYKENVNLTKRIFYNLLTMQDSHPKTSLPSPKLIEDTFSKIPLNDQIVGIFLSSHLSGTYQSVKYFSKNRKNCYIIDSHSASAGERILVEEAVKMRNQGKCGSEIFNRLENLKHKIKLYACIDNIEFLQKGGRISSSKARIGSVANIKPVITMEDGKVVVAHKSIGMKRGMNYIIHRLNHNKPDLKYPFHIMYTHIHHQGVVMKESLMEAGYNINNHSLINAGAVIGSHIGTNSCGIAYVSK